MKSLGIRGLVLLVVVLAFAVPAFASPPNPVSATVVADLITMEGTVTGTFEGTLEHIYTEGRADRAHFSGCVDDRCGELEMLLVLQWILEPWAPGLEGKWVILDGSGDLESLRGQGTFVVDLDFPILTMTLDGQYHFDPDQGS
jgi:hypothetical protein